MKRYLSGSTGYLVSRLVISSGLALACMHCSPQWNVEPRIGLPGVNPPPPPHELILDRGKEREVVLEELSSTELTLIANDAGGRIPIKRADLVGAGEGTTVEIESTSTVQVQRLLFHVQRTDRITRTRVRNLDASMSLPICVSGPDAPCKVQMRPGAWNIGLYGEHSVKEELDGNGISLELDQRPVRLEIKAPQRKQWRAGTNLWAAGLLPAVVGAAFMGLAADPDPHALASSKKLYLTSGVAVFVPSAAAVVVGFALSASARNGTIRIEPKALTEPSR